MALVDEALLRDIAHNKDLLVAANGDLQTVFGPENVRQALLRRLITTPGALAHRPDYGVGIKDFQNAPASLDNQRDLALRVKEQFERDFRVSSVTGLRFQVDDEQPEKTTIFVKYNIIGVGEVEQPFVPFGVG
jgi:phage baseplate assembly protein W